MLLIINRLHRGEILIVIDCKSLHRGEILNVIDC